MNSAYKCSLFIVLQLRVQHQTFSTSSNPRQSPRILTQSHTDPLSPHPFPLPLPRPLFAFSSHGLSVFPPFPLPLPFPFSLPAFPSGSSGYIPATLIASSSSFNLFPRFLGFGGTSVSNASSASLSSLSRFSFSLFRLRNSASLIRGGFGRPSRKRSSGGA